MVIKLKSKKYPLQYENYDIKIFNNQENQLYTINAYNKSAIVSTAQFRLFNRPAKHIFLGSIQTQEHYQNKGYATAILKTLEYFAYINKFDEIDSVLNNSSQQAKAFFESNGYVTYRNGFKTNLSKTIDYQEVITDIAPNIIGFYVE